MLLPFRTKVQYVLIMKRIEDECKAFYIHVRKVEHFHSSVLNFQSLNENVIFAVWCLKSYLVMYLLHQLNKIIFYRHRVRDLRNGVRIFFSNFRKYIKKV